MDQLRQNIARAQTGNKDAFAEIVKQFHPVALRYAQAILGDADLAQDAVQESFVQAYISLSSLREPSAFPAWFRAIVSNCSRRLIRGKRVPLLPLEDAVEAPSDAPSPHELVERKHARQRVLEAVRELPERERAVTRLFYFDGYSQSEIADLLGAPVSTINNRLYSSRRLLRNLLVEVSPPAQGRRYQTEPKEIQMALTYEPTTRKLLRGDAEVSIRVMTREDIPAVRKLDDEITAGLDLANAQRPPGDDWGPGGPWADDEWLTEHFERYESAGNITLLAENESGNLVGLTDLWATQEPQPFGHSLNVEYVDYLWEYYLLGLQTVLLQEAEKVARTAGLPAVDIGTNTYSGDYPTLRRFGMKVFYEYDNVWCRCKPAPADWRPSSRTLPPEAADKSGLLRVSHWSPTNFDFAYEPGRPGIQEFLVDGHRVIADFWRCWEPGHEAPIGCELFAPPEALTSPRLMSRILRETAFLAGEAGTDELPLPCPCDIAVDTSLVDVVKREFAFAWMRKTLD